MHAVDGLLHLLVVALAGNLDLLPQVAATDQRQNAVAFADGQQDGVQHFVDAFHDARIGALELLGLAALRKLAFTRRLRQPPQFLLQPLQHHGHVVHGLLHLLVVALIGLRDQLVDLAVGDLGQNAVAFADGQQDGVQHFVDALDDLAIVALVLGGVGARGQLALPGRLHQRRRPRPPAR